MRSIFAFLAEVRRLAMPYFWGEDRWAGRALLAAVVLLELGTVFLNVQFNEWNARFYNAVQNKDITTFWHELFYFCGLAALFIIAAVYQLYLRQWLQIRWRSWLTRKYVSRWLGDGTHYRMRTVGDPADNPDQRIAEDLELFTSRTIALSIGLLNAVVTTASFVVILWMLSNQAPLTVFGVPLAIPGYLVWASLIYAGLGTLITHLIGNVLARLNFEMQKYEADFRYHLVRVRENGEQIALLKGEPIEGEKINERFLRYFNVFIAKIKAEKRLTWFTAGYNQASVVFPYIVVSPAYFAGKIQLGILFQTASAFNSVQSAFSFFVTAYTTLAEYRAVVRRLIGFENAIGGAALTEAQSEIKHDDAAAGAAIRVDGMALVLPTGRPVLAADGIAIPPGDSVLVTGATGSGKSTLFRAIAGIWPFGKGRIGVQAGAKLLVLPQKPYLPFGTLADVLAYPEKPDVYDTAALGAALNAVGLSRLGGRLSEEASWPHVLSLGEQQRISLARALLMKPDILLLDESTSAIDEVGEATLYQLIKQQLPKTTVLSIGHRSTLAAFHKDKLEAKPDGDGMFRLASA
ncbi:MAG TPA: ABC transporter ATP-binding protein/permease [Xanthobacteraceae bacterium]|nr:ABC transporter ATP-binding protein/permease [Xanthobacteraceae bacterium]